MRRTMASLWVVFCLFVSAAMFSCSGGGGSGGRASAESVFDPGAPVPARGFEDSIDLELMAGDASGGFVTLVDGTCVEPGTKRLAVRLKGDPTDVERVFVSDGGVYQVEAVKGQDGLYTCGFDLKGDRLTRALLVQAIHTDMRASKAKVVVRTSTEGDDALVLKGVGAAIADELLDASKAQVSDLVDAVVKGVTTCLSGEAGSLVTRFDYGGLSVNLVESSAGRDSNENAVLHINLTLRDVDLQAFGMFGQALVSTAGNDLNIDAYAAVGDVLSSGGRGLVVDLGDSAAVSFSRDFFLRPMVEGFIAFAIRRIELPTPSAPLERVLSSLGAHLPATVTLGDTTVDVKDLMAGLDLDLSGYAFMDLCGLPADSGLGVLAVEGGLYLGEGVDWNVPGGAGTSGIDTEGIFADMLAKVVDYAFEKTRDKYGALITSLSYGDSDPGTDDVEVDSISFTGSGDSPTRTMRVRFTVRDVDFGAVKLLGYSLIHTSGNDLTLDVDVDMAYSGPGTGGLLAVDVRDVYGVDFKDRFLGRAVVEEIVRQDMEGLGPLQLDMGSLFSGVDPQDLLSACTGFGPTMPPVEGVESRYIWGLGLDGDNTVAVAVTQDTINHVLSETVVPGFEWDVYKVLRPILGRSFTGFQEAPVPGEETIMSLGAPPVVDLRGDRIRLELDGVRLLYRNEGKSVWEASVDLDLILSVRVEGGELAFYLETAPENCHFHIMKDNTGHLGIFDHSNLVNDVVERLPVLLGGEAGGALFTMDLDGFAPYVVFDDTDEPLKVKASQGCLYICAAAASLDIGWLQDLFGKE